MDRTTKKPAHGLFISDYRVWPIDDARGGLVAGANITLNDALAIRRIMMFDLGHKRFCLFPADRSQEPAVHPVNHATRAMIEGALWAAYDELAMKPERRSA